MEIGKCAFCIVFHSPATSRTSRLVSVYETRCSIESMGMFRLLLSVLWRCGDCAMRGNIPEAASTPIPAYRYVPARHSSSSPARSRGPSVTSMSDVCDRTVVRIRRSGLQQERIRVVCTTRRQHVSRMVTVSDVCHTLPPLRKHVTIIRLGSQFPL